ncbi:MAG TPA: S53 family peptidase [Tepidisphaeraceae bacterium]|jgi:subtilase family serine protease|nr:S53 family peptidase [Tepidisphaeraceae bacterium]
MRHPFFIEALEPRQLLSLPPGLSPREIRHAYDLDHIIFSKGKRPIHANGAGQTIAIVDAYDAPNIAHDLRIFSKTYHLPIKDAEGDFILSKATTDPKPPVDPGWALEISLDVEWAHAIAPRAHILLVEAANASTSALLHAIDYARRQKGVSAVSLSWGGDESPFEQFYDQYLTTPPGHIGGSNLRGGVTFVSSSGDSGAPASWPAVSPNVVAVGGTTLHLDSKNEYAGETAWAGSGGGLSVYEPVTTVAPDVAYDADPTSGFAVYDSTPGSQTRGWQVVGGTSAGAPQWAAMIALADQGRALHHAGSLSSSQSLTALYSIPAADFHDITTGSNGYSARPGYDLVTGRGTPRADQLIPDLINITLPRNA